LLSNPSVGVVPSAVYQVIPKPDIAIRIITVDR